MRPSYLGAVAVAAVLLVVAVRWEVVPAWGGGADTASEAPLPLPAGWVDHDQLAAWLEAPVRPAAARYGWAGPSRSQFRVGERGQLTVEVLAVDAELPARVPVIEVPRTERERQEERHAEDLAFAAGEAVHERFRADRSTPVRGPVVADLTVDCVRVVASGIDLDDHQLGALRGSLHDDLELRLREWLAQAGDRSPCGSVTATSGRTHDALERACTSLDRLGTVAHDHAEGAEVWAEVVDVPDVFPNRHEFREFRTRDAASMLDDALREHPSALPMHRWDALAGYQVRIAAAVHDQELVGLGEIWGAPPWTVLRKEGVALWGELGCEGTSVAGAPGSGAWRP
jgi:hypothetical protein